MTLRELVDQHPEWLDLELTVYSNSGELDFVGGSGNVYEDTYQGETVIVFTGN